MKKVINEFSNENLKKFLPKDKIREDGFSHEWSDFTMVIADMFIDLLQDEEEWIDFAVSKGMEKKE
ncbi:hypothetical protein KAT42_02780 [Candidatus Bathyarchaeota archaeon]|nr:hypothetical protein [Candidatus Bathyarchaeota archaeon]